MCLQVQPRLGACSDGAGKAVMLNSAVEDTMKKLGIKSLLLVLSAFAVLLAGCSNSLDERSDSEGSGAFGSVSINDAGRAIFADDISYAVATVTGTGIKAGYEPTSGQISVSGGKGKLSVEKIPTGKNRIITVQAFSSSNGKLNGVTLRAICDVEADKTTSVIVNWDSTALGNVFASLLSSGKNIASIDSSDISKIYAAIPDVSAPFVNAAKIASDYATGGGSGLKSSSEYKLSAATVDLTTKNISGYKVYVGDPSSEIQIISAETSSGTLTVAPGTWPIYAVDTTGAVKGFAYGTFTSGGEHTITITNDGSIEIAFDRVVIDDRIIVHAKGYSHIWAWTDSENFTGGTWPGKGMTAEANSWYSTEIQTTKCKVILSNSGNGQNSKDGDELTAGEWWYKDGKWTDYNPEKPNTPSVQASVVAGTYLSAQTVTLTSTNGSSDVIYYTTNGTEPDESSNKYSSPITVSSSLTLKAKAYNENANPCWGNVSPFRYVIDPNADLEAPVITANKPTGRYKEALSDISFTITDNKSDGFTVYYTIDGSVPNTSSTVYATCAAGSNSVTGKNLSLAMNNSMTVRLLAVDKAGNENGPKAFYYACSDVNYSADRWDPRQESIYFLLTARWFDGDPSNTVGDQWCSSEEDPSWRGDFKGLVEKMDYIKALGFTCIWITPIVQNRGPLCYHGYHAWDMYKEDARLVSDGYDFQRVIDEAHKRGMKICLDVVLQHSGRFGLKDFAEIKYNRDPNSYPVPVGWEGFSYDEAAYEKAYFVSNKTGIPSVQKFPNDWEYDGLKSPGKYPAGWKIDGVDVGGQDIPPSADVVGDVRPFTATDISAYSYLATAKRSDGVSPYQWPTTESYQLTIDTGDFSVVNGSKTSNYTYEQYVKSDGLHFHGWANGFNDSGMFDKYPDANLRSIHEDCPDLNTESKEVQDYVIGAYKRYIDMGVDMFRVDTVMHIDKKTLNDHFWPAFFEEAATETAKAARGGGDFFVFGEVANFINNLMNDKPAPIRQCNYTWDETVCPDSTDLSNNHALNGNAYRQPDYSHKAVPKSDYHVSTIDIVSHNGFCNGFSGGYNNATCDGAYNDATYLAWYTDSHDYGPNKATTRWNASEAGFAAAWSMLFTYRGIPIVYYGSEIKFAAGKPNDWPGSVKNTINETGRAYYGEHLMGSITATDFGEYTASGEVATTLSSELSKHLRDLNRIRLAVPALQMGQYSKDGHNGGWAGYKRRYTGTNKITGESVDSYALVGVGAGTHSWSGVLPGDYVDIISGSTVSANGGSISVSAHGSDDAALVVLVKTGLATAAPGKVAKESPYLGF